MGLTSPGFKKLSGTVQSGAPAPPTADAGSDQAQNDTRQVTLNGSGSTAGVTYAWTLQDPDQTDRTSLLSSATAASPTFTPKDIAGNWSASLTVTKDSVSAKDNVSVRIGSTGGWIRLNPTAAASTYSGGHHSTVTWSDDNANWTTLTLSDRVGGSVLKPEDFELKWFEPDVANIATIFGIDFKIITDESYSQPLLTDWCFAGVVVSNTTTIASSVGCYVVYTTTNQSQNSKNTCRGNQSNIAWGMSGAGYDSTQGKISYKPYYGAFQRCTYNKTTVSGSSHTSTADTSIAFSPSVTWSDPLKFALAGGRSGTTSGNKTFKFQVWYRLQKR